MENDPNQKQRKAGEDEKQITPKHKQILKTISEQHNVHSIIET